MRRTRPTAPVNVVNFGSHIDFGPDCWIWSGAQNVKGYGTFGKWLAHRLAYLLMVGDLSGQLDIDHVCGRRDCVNPAHLEQVTHRLNLLRRRINPMSARTHCPWGHPYDYANTYFYRQRRNCRACNSKTGRARRAVMRASVIAAEGQS